MNTKRKEVNKVDLSKRKLFSIAALGEILRRIWPESERYYNLPRNKPTVPGSEKWKLGEEKIVKSICAQCEANCGIEVRVVEGRAVKIKGNPAHPLNEGILGPRGNCGLFTLYDPDRIRNPLKRTGAKGEGKWEEISWDEAIDTIISKIREIQNIAVLCGLQYGLTKELFWKFAESLNARFYDYFSKSYSTAPILKAAYDFASAVVLPTYDAEKTNYILSLGSAIFESSCYGIRFSRAMYSIRYGKPTIRAKVVQVEPFYSYSAEQADEWIEIKLGRYDILCLSIANVLISEGLYDKEFVSKKTSNFEKFYDIARNFPPERAEKETGIKGRDIVRLAKELWYSRPSTILIDERSCATSNGEQIAKIAFSLQALLGNINKEGGLLFHQGQNPNFPKSEAKDGIPFYELPEHKNYLIFIYYMNPAYSEPEGERWEKFLKDNFVISFSPFLDETTMLSDIILPDHTYLERLEDAITYLARVPVMGLRSPVVPPLYNTRQSQDVIIQIGKRLFPETFPWENFKEFLVERIGSENFSRLEKDGFIAEPPKYCEPPDGRFRLFSEQIEDPVLKGEGDIILVPYKNITYAQGSGANIPYLAELSALIKQVPTHKAYHTFAEISPETAEKYGIKNGEKIYVVSEVSRILCSALVKKGIPADMVLIELGKGHKAFGRFAKGKGANPREISARVPTKSGNLAVISTKVRIEKTGG